MENLSKAGWTLLAVLILSLSAGSAPSDAGAAAPISPEDARQIGVDAYIYLYPLVTMDITRRRLTNVEPGKTDRGPMNTFAHIRSFPSGDFKEVVRPNFDTLYSSGWLDLTAGPVVVSAPDTGGRYYMLPMLDMWTDVFAVPGKRTTGTQAENFAVVPPGWNGELPAGMQRIDAPTPYVWIIGRTQINGPGDYDAVHKIQDGYRITPLAQWGKEPEPPKAVFDPTVDMTTPPLDQINRMPALTFFKYAAELMKVNPPHITDQSILARMSRIGLEPGRSFDADALDPAVKIALEKAAADGLAIMDEKKPKLARVVNGWLMNTDTMGVYGNFYLKRAVIAMIGLGANQPEDAVYPVNVTDANGNPMKGDGCYVLHFNKEELPPADAFWSVTMYDENGFPVPNSIDRYAIGDRDALKYNDDGSLDIYIQHDDPGPKEASNWLPAPKGPVSLTMRLYQPKSSVIDGFWAPPAVKPVPECELG